MSENLQHHFISTCADLADAIRECDVQIRVGEQNRDLRQKYEGQLSTHKQNVEYCELTLDAVKPIVNDLMQYLNDRKRESMNNINNALRMAGEIIPEAPEGIHIEYDKEEAWIATAEGLTVQNTQGGGYKQTSSNFLRYVTLVSNPDKLHTIFFDENFGAVSQENSANLSLYLDNLCSNAQIISIEQKPQIYSNIDCTMYTFKKDGAFSSVTRTELKRDLIPTKEVET